MKIVLIRHGDPDYAHDTLTEAGWKEAGALADFMVKEYGDAYKEGRMHFYCSPLGRARDTAGETLKALGAKAEVVPFLQEFGNAQIKDPRTGKNRITWDLYPADWIDQPELYRNEEWWKTPLMSSGPVKEQYDWVCQGLDEIIRRHGYEREGLYYRPTRRNHDIIVLFCHMGISSVILSHLLNCPPCIPWQSSFIAPTSRTVYDMEEREDGIAVFRLRCLGDISHLAMANVPVSESGLYGEIYPEPNRCYPDFR